jgi:hypothetical protein
VNDFEQSGARRNQGLSLRSFLHASEMVGAAALANGLSFPANAQKAGSLLPTDA